MTIAIQVERLSKKYLIRHRHNRSNESLRERLSNFARNIGRHHTPIKYEEFWAIRDLSFQIEKGDCVGFVGSNGAGKSTLLKILSRITEPTSGRVSICGRVASLLEVGTGFHPELTGRENIFLNGAILGMQREEIRRKFDEIVVFAEVEKFLDTPVKHYSSGMYVRLAFSVAAHLEPEVLIVDEVLAVGDSAFQKKCLAKMNKACEDGVTILFVSHNINAIQNLCRTGILLAGGQLIIQGEVNTVIHKYHEQFQQSDKIFLEVRRDRVGTGVIRFTSVEFLDGHGRSVQSYRSGQHVKLLLRFNAEEKGELKNVVITVVIENEFGIRMLYLSNAFANKPFLSIPESVRCFELDIERCPLPPGSYHLNLHCSIDGEVSDWIRHAELLTVEAGDFYGTGYLPHIINQGCVLIPHSFHLHH